MIGPDDGTLTVRDGYSPSPLLEVWVENDGRLVEDDSRLHDLRQVILIHGFANSQPDATRSYEIFRKKLNTVAWTDMSERQIQLWGFQWPGDRPSRHDLFERIGSATTYPARIAVAEQAGEALARLLQRLGDRQEVVLVAHSLGCRVALRCLKYLRELRQSGQARVTATCLLAGAVPEKACVPGATFGNPLAGCDEIVLHSTEDKVLRRAFPLGQAVYGESGRATGATGGPDDRWRQRRNTYLDHGDYWGNVLVAELVGQLLQFYRQVTLPEYRLPDARLV